MLDKFLLLKDIKVCVQVKDGLDALKRLIIGLLRCIFKLRKDFRVCGHTK